MQPQAAPRAKYQTPLREAQRDLTRNRIKNAARKLFFQQHYEATTMDEIALEAGLRRSTLYLHYKDKAEILREVIAEYAPKAKEILSNLPGPAPSLDAIHRWVKTVARFVSRERVPLSIIREARNRSRDPEQYETLTSELIAALGTSNPRFLAASRPDAPAVLRARGLMLLEELTYACSIHLENAADMRGKAMLLVTAEDFHAFLTAAG